MTINLFCGNDEEGYFNIVIENVSKFHKVYNTVEITFDLDSGSSSGTEYPHAYLVEGEKQVEVVSLSDSTTDTNTNNEYLHLLGHYVKYEDGVLHVYRSKIIEVTIEDASVETTTNPEGGD